jgi:uncharacterized membrane protein YeiB
VWKDFFQGLAHRRRVRFPKTNLTCYLTAVVISFFLQSKIGFGLAPALANIAGVIVAVLALGALLTRHRKRKS